MEMESLYDSPEGRSIAGSLASILTGLVIQLLQNGKRILPFSGYAKNRDEMLRVMRNHRRAALW